MPYPDSAYRQAFVWRAVLSTPMLSHKALFAYVSWRKELDNRSAFLKIDEMSAAARVALSNRIVLKPHRPRIVRWLAPPRSDI